MTIVAIKIQSMPYTYILEWTMHNKRYIGARWAKGCNPNDLWKEYFSSSDYVREFVQIHGEPDIILIDRVCTTPVEAMEREKELLRKYDAVKNDQFLNKAIGGIFDHRDPDILNRMSISAKIRAKNATAEEIEKRISPLRGRKQSPELITKRTSKRIGCRHSDETKKKIGAKSKGRTKTAETRKKISLSKLGVKYAVIKCPHCSKIGGDRVMKRWHFSRCTLKI